MFNAPTTSLCASIPQLKHLNSRLCFLTFLELHQGHFDEVPLSLTTLTLIPKFSAVVLRRSMMYLKDQKLWISELILLPLSLSSLM